MPQSLVKILVHMVFSRKGRIRIIPPEIEPRLYGYISKIIRNNGGRMIIAGGDADHSHILSSIGRINISELIGDIKRDSSAWIKHQDRRFEKFYWQRGYGAFSIGQSQVPQFPDTFAIRRSIIRPRAIKMSFANFVESMR
jgi:REP element-mobilizing transposase RayT